jgi:hypothetical protein
LGWGSHGSAGNSRDPNEQPALSEERDTLQRRFLSTGGIILNRGPEIIVRLNRRTYSAVLRQASLPETITVPWWEGRTLRYKYA